MYIPKYYQMSDYENIKAFMSDHNFVTIVTTNDARPVATHLPVTIQEENNILYVSGHFAKANKQWQTIENNENILIIFHGPHSYISSTWYEKEYVPTWDYQSIHAYGKGYLLNENELIEELTQLLDKYEGYRENGAIWSNISEKTKKQMKGIVGFKVKVAQIEAAYKLSQNRSNQDKENIISHLQESTNSITKRLAEEIKKF